MARPQERKFLGFSFTAGPEVKRVIAPKAMERFKERIREITRRAKGVSMKTTMDELAPYMRGWRGYFGFCETPEVLIALTGWVRRDYERPCGGSGKHRAVAGPRYWNWGCESGWQQYRRQQSRPMVSREGQGPCDWAFQCLLHSLGLPSLFEDC